MEVRFCKATFLLAFRVKVGYRCKKREEDAQRKTPLLEASTQIRGQAGRGDPRAGLEHWET